MFERFTPRARKVMALANQQAQRYSSQGINSQDILLSLLLEGTGVGYTALINQGINTDNLKRDLEKKVQLNRSKPIMGKWPQSRPAELIEKAIDGAREMKHAYVGTEHLLYALVALEDEGTKCLREQGLTPDIVKKQVLEILNPNGSPQDLCFYEQIIQAGYKAYPVDNTGEVLLLTSNRDMVGHLRKNPASDRGYDISLFYTYCTIKQVLDLRDWLERNGHPYREEDPDSKPVFAEMLRDESRKATNLADRLEGKVEE